MFAEKMNMKSIYYILLTFPIILLFSSCEDEEISPGNPANPPGLPNYFIPDCDTMKVDIVFSGNPTELPPKTWFFSDDGSGYFSIDGVQDWNNMCNQYLDEAAMITAGLTYVDIWTSTVVPTQYGSNAELKYDPSDPSNPTLEIKLTNDESYSNIYGDNFSLSLEIPDINIKSINTPYTIPASSIWLQDVMLYNQYYSMEYTITFTIIDLINKIFEGNIDIIFDKYLNYYDPITGAPVYRDYPIETTFPFYANVDFRLICRP
tara:strand:- start:174 stop:959 length:786 start_codon:yes stop_codon:yes gene_type:complete